MVSIKVLFVDDDEGALDQARIFLDRINEDISIDTVTDANEALGRLDSEDYDVIISDYKMPEMDGLEFLENIRKERNEDIPFIMFTGKGREEVAMKALNLGADRYVQKGGEPKAQFEMLAHAIEQESRHYRTEKSLSKRNKLIRNIFDEAKEGFYIQDMSGKIKFINQSFADISGFEKRELLGMDFRELLAEECREEVQDIDFMELSGNIDLEIRTKEGHIKNIKNIIIPLKDETGAIEEYLGISHDVTDVKEKERKLKSKERLFQSIFNDPDVFLGILEPDGTLISANEPSLEFIGVEEWEVEGKKFWNTPWWDHSEEMQEHLKEAISRAAEGEYLDYEATHVSKEGEVLSIDFSLRPVKNEEGEVVSLLAEGKHITGKEDLGDYLSSEE